MVFFPFSAVFCFYSETVPRDDGDRKNCPAPHRAPLRGPQPIPGGVRRGPVPARPPGATGELLFTFSLYSTRGWILSVEENFEILVWDSSLEDSSCWRLRSREDSRSRLEHQKSVILNTSL